MGWQLSPLGGLQDRHRVLTVERTVETQATLQCTPSAVLCGSAVVSGHPLGIGSASSCG
jgi:hypothetical protein